MACVQNQTITRPSITDPSRKQKITTSIHNKLPARRTVSQPDCLSSAAEDEDLYQAVPSSTITNSVMQMKQMQTSKKVSDEIFVEPTVNENPKLSSDNTVPYGAESSGKSEEESKGLFKRNCNAMSSNGILVGKVVRTLQHSGSSCQNADEGRSQHELPKTDSLNGAIRLVNESKENGLKLDDSTCRVEPVKPSEMFFSKTNGLLET